MNKNSIAIMALHKAFLRRGPRDALKDVEMSARVRQIERKTEYHRKCGEIVFAKLKTTSGKGSEPGPIPAIDHDSDNVEVKSLLKKRSYVAQMYLPR